MYSYDFSKIKSSEYIFQTPKIAFWELQNVEIEAWGQNPRLFA